MEQSDTRPELPCGMAPSELDAGRSAGVAGGFTLDTSGCVTVPRADPVVGYTYTYFWSDLSPFEQGYIEAMAADQRTHFLGLEVVPFGFSDLAPETLARIMEDCGRRLRHYPSDAREGDAFGPKERGRWFWKWRSEGSTKNFPPLAPYLGDDGLVYLREGR